MYIFEDYVDLRFKILFGLLFAISALLVLYFFPNIGLGLPVMVVAVMLILVFLIYVIMFVYEKHVNNTHTYTSIFIAITFYVVFLMTVSYFVTRSI